jgi:putative transposase
LETNGIKISMDGKGRATDNAWIERFWKTIKYQYLHLNPCDNGIELLEAVNYYIGYYNQKKHQSIDSSPDLKFYESIEKRVA